MSTGEILTVAAAIIVALIAATPPTLMGLVTVRKANEAKREAAETRRNVGDANGYGSITAQIEHMQGRLDAHVAEQDARHRAVDRRIDGLAAGVIERHDALVARLDAHEGREFARHDALVTQVVREIRRHHPDPWDGHTERRAQTTPEYREDPT